MQVKFFGTRGSLPVPGPTTVRYGGNTSCTAVRSSGGTLVVLDMGTGAFALGQELAASGKPVKGHVLISHTHWDHIQGLPFFAPFFRPGNEWDVYAPRGLGPSLRETLSGQMQYTYFPLELEQLGATIRYHDLVEGALTLGDFAVEAQYLNHPAMTLGYRLNANGATLVYALDHEPFMASLATGNGPIEGADRRHAEFLADADLVIHDAQYLAKEFALKVGWGHSTVEYALHIARAAGVKRLALAHHDPGRNDDAMDALVRHYRSLEGRVDVVAAAEGLELELASSTVDRSSPAIDAFAHRPEVAIASATTRPALVHHTVLLAGKRACLAQLGGILASDRVRVVTCTLAGMSAAVQKENPSLIVIADAGTSKTVADGVASIRNLNEMGRSLPIIQVGDGNCLSTDQRGITDHLAEPFTDSYARTRLRAWLMRRACRWGLPPVPENETQRLKALHALQILDTPADRLLDGIVAAASDIFSVPIVALTLIDHDRQWFKASCGLSSQQTPRDESFCAHVVADPVPTVVPDCLLDDRFAENPSVIGSPHLRFYAGYPLILAGGPCIGTLCIADVRPRQLAKSAMDRLAQLAALALNVIQQGGHQPSI